MLGAEAGAPRAQPPIEAGAARAGKQQIEGKSVPSKREAKRRALLKLLDRIPARGSDATLAKKTAGSAPQILPQADVPVPAKAPLRQPLQDK